MGQDELYKVVSTPIGVESQTGDYNEPDYIDADNESHGRKIGHGTFRVTGNNSGFVGIDDLYWKIVMQTGGTKFCTALSKYFR